jgi:ligand-binding sensor domain-containing protein
MRILLSLVLFLLTFPVQASAQALRPGEWRTYTSMRSVSDVAISEDSLYAWAATSGGAFRVKLSDHSDLLELRNSDGLSDNELTAIAVDLEGNAYLGGRSGSLDIWSRTSGTIRQERSIMEIQDFGQKSINDIFIDGDRVYLATGYGLTVYNRRTRAFGETVVAFGSFPAQEAVLQVLTLRDTIYAVLARGVAYAPVSTFNLNNPSSWTTIVSTTSGALKAAIVHLGSVYVGADSGLVRVDVQLSQLSNVGALFGVPVAELAQQGEELFAIDPRGDAQLGRTIGLGSVSWRSVPRDRAGSNPINALAVGRNGLLLAGTTLSGLLIGIQNGDSVSQAFPSGPVSNSVGDINFAASRSLLFAAHSGLGASVFDVEKDDWVQYPNRDPRMPDVSYRRVVFDSIRNVAWFGLTGAGVLKVHGMETGNVQYTRYDNAQGLPSAVPDNDNFVIGGRGMIDDAGKFVVPVWATNGQGLAFYDEKDDRFTTVPLSNLRSTYGLVAQDLNGTYWVGTESNTNPPPYGLFYHTKNNLNGSIFGAPTGVLNSTSINALIVDQDNALWVGSNAGLQIIADVYKATTSNAKFTAIRKVPFVEEQFVRAIAVDGVGNKWIGTDNGVFVLSADGTDSVARFTSDNSPLIDNVISSMTIDTKRGEAYLGTDKGISRVSTIFKAGEADYSGIMVYPNPVVQTAEVLPSVFIKGLVGGSQVNIYTSSGRLVASIDGKDLGGIVTWNGRDDNGNLLPSGVYLVSATSLDSSERGQAKIVLIRKD